jgi:hypothetical protein
MGDVYGVMGREKGTWSVGDGWDLGVSRLLDLWWYDNPLQRLILTPPSGRVVRLRLRSAVARSLRHMRLRLE